MQNSMLTDEVFLMATFRKKRIGMNWMILKSSEPVNYP